MRMAPLLTALVPFLLLPALLAGFGHPAAPAFAGYATGLFLLTVAAQVGIGIARLPVLCLGGFAAAGAGLMPLLTLDLEWSTAASLAVTPLLGLVLGGVAWLLIRGLTAVVAAALLLALLLGLASLPAITTEPGQPGAGFALDAALLLPLFVTAVLLFAAGRLAGSVVARMHEAAILARLPADGLGVDLAIFRAAALVVAASLAALGGGILALGPATVIGVDPGDWVALSLALFAIGRLGGGRLGAALLAALPLALLPKFTVVLAPHFVDPTLAAALVAIVLQLVFRADGTAAWQPPPPILASSLAQPSIDAQRWAE